MKNKIIRIVKIFYRYYETHTHTTVYLPKCSFANTKIFKVIFLNIQLAWLWFVLFMLTLEAPVSLERAPFIYKMNLFRLSLTIYFVLNNTWNHSYLMRKTSASLFKRKIIMDSPMWTGSSCVFIVTVSRFFRDLCKAFLTCKWLC